jgi:hypothetical protein
MLNYTKDIKKNTSGGVGKAYAIIKKTFRLKIFSFKHNVSEPGLYLRHQVKAYSVWPNR